MTFINFLVSMMILNILCLPAVAVRFDQDEFKNLNIANKPKVTHEPSNLLDSGWTVRSNIKDYFTKHGKETYSSKILLCSDQNNLIERIHLAFLGLHCNILIDLRENHKILKTKYPEFTNLILIDYGKKSLLTTDNLDQINLIFHLFYQKGFISGEVMNEFINNSNKPQ